LIKTIKTHGNLFDIGGQVIWAHPVKPGINYFSELINTDNNTVQQTITSPDSDPDYNLTLTADSLLRQNANQAMDVDSGTHSVATSPDFYTSNQVPKPHFFIDPQTCPMQNSMAFSPPKHMTGAKHVFTVETIQDPNQEFLAFRTGPSVSFSGQVTYPQQPNVEESQQQQLCGLNNTMGQNQQLFKSQSYPCYGTAGFPQP
jgi:hypothetical protein